MNMLLIIHHPDVQDKEKLHARIDVYSESSYFIYDNIAIVKTTCNTKELYEKFTEDGFETTQMLIAFFSNEYLGFWGRMNAELWQWLDQNQDNNSLSNSQMDEIVSLKLELERVKNEHENLKEKISYLQTKNERKTK